MDPLNLCGASSSKSLNSGILPNDWLTANIFSSIQERYNKLKYSCQLSTIINCGLLQSYGTRHIPLYHGTSTTSSTLRSGFSCNTQLIFLVDDILKAHYQVDLVLLDFSKAFDTVAHNKLLLKLSNYGKQSNIHKWITTWLTSRTQRVLVEGCTSSTKEVLSGVPLGTVLGPLMFLLYINDIDTNNTSSIRLYTDYCVLYRVIKLPQDRLLLQQDLSHLVQRTNTWQITLNIGKCMDLYQIILLQSPQYYP